MEACFITTYRCNARCQMCGIWEKSSEAGKEIGPEVLKKLPKGLKRINITGGEPGLRKDLLEIVSELNGHANKLDISTNGFFTDKLVEIGKTFPKVAFRISVEGLPELNDKLRGIKNGFDRALRTIIHLRQIGVRDVGFGVVISDKNNDDLLDLYSLCTMLGIDLGSSTMHNSFYFSKYDNKINDLDNTVRSMQRFIEGLLKSRRGEIRLRIKDWGRAFINYGIMRHIQGEQRPIPCGAGTDIFFVDPYGAVLACNGSDDPWVMGSLNDNTFDEIWRSKKAEEARAKVSSCQKNCWMVGSARPAMRAHPWVPLLWIIKNKIRLMLQKDIWCEQES